MNCPWVIVLFLLVFLFLFSLNRRETFVGQMESGPKTLDSGLKYRRPEMIGWRWKYGWKPYYWREYPCDAPWIPARGPYRDEGQGMGYHIPQSRLCRDKAYRDCVGKMDFKYCYNRAYGKCLDIWNKSACVQKNDLGF